MNAPEKSVIDLSKASARKELPAEELALVSVIERAARDPGVDMDKMERLLNMHERIVGRQAEGAFNLAMTAAQAEMRAISTDAENSQTHSRYATYAKLDRVLRPIYIKHGFSLSFGNADSPLPEHVRITCKVRHISGHSEMYFKDMPADGKGAKGGDVMTKTHASGAAQSYGMRYLLRGIWNVAVGEDDNDGNGPVELVSEEQVANLKALLTEVGADIPKFLKWAKVGSLSEIPARSYETCVKTIEAKRK